MFSYKMTISLFLQILDRKNVEIEEIKDHYRSKVGELESAVKRMEKKSKYWNVPKMT